MFLHSQVKLANQCIFPSTFYRAVKLEKKSTMPELFWCILPYPELVGESYKSPGGLLYLFVLQNMPSNRQHLTAFRRYVHTFLQVICSFVPYIVRFLPLPYENLQVCQERFLNMNVLKERGKHPSPGKLNSEASFYSN